MRPRPIADPEPTRAETPPPTDLLVYDDDCGFCTAAARWLQDHSRWPLHLVPISALPLPGILGSPETGSLPGSAHFVTSEGWEYHGGAAITRALRLVRGGVAFACLDLPLLRTLRAAAYQLVARHRHRISRLLGTKCAFPDRRKV